MRVVGNSVPLLGYMDHLFSIMCRFDFFWLLCVNFLYLDVFSVCLKKNISIWELKTNAEKNSVYFLAMFNMLITIITPKSVK